MKNMKQGKKYKKNDRNKKKEIKDKELKKILIEEYIDE